VLSAAVPVQRYQQVLGALLLTRDNRAIAAALREVRYDMLTIAAAALGITVLLSLYLAGTITQPIVRLARAADEVRLARESRPEIPDLGKRGDEIGDLNDALRSMTGALWLRINTIESFAADVAHELKNPLTSLRSAIEKFEGCPLKKAAKNTVVCDGAFDAADDHRGLFCGTLHGRSRDAPHRRGGARGLAR